MAQPQPEKYRYSDCRSPEGHRDHLCNLMERGMTEEIRRLSADPRYACGNCSAQAHCAEDLCRPLPL